MTPGEVHDCVVLLNDEGRPTGSASKASAHGVVENEIRPVCLATATAGAGRHADEVVDHAWIDPLDPGRAIRLAPVAFSPWLVLQAHVLPLLRGGGGDRDDADRWWATGERTSG